MDRERNFNTDVEEDSILRFQSLIELVKVTFSFSPYDLLSTSQVEHCKEAKYCIMLVFVWLSGVNLKIKPAKLYLKSPPHVWLLYEADIEVLVTLL